MIEQYHAHCLNCGSIIRLEVSDEFGAEIVCHVCFIDWTHNLPPGQLAPDSQCRLPECTATSCGTGDRCCFPD